MKILLTGSHGMVGSNIIKHSLAINHKILSPTSKELNLLNTENVHDYINIHNPDMVIHTAGIVGGIQANIARPVRFLVDNMYMGLNILMSAKDCGVKRFMNLGSSCMYPRNIQNPLSEDLILKGELEPTNEGYAIAKVASTRICEYINIEDSSFLYKTVIPCNLYGKYDKFNSKYSHMIPAVIKKINNAKNENKESVDIWGDGLARREFMYAGDFADFVFYAIDNFEKMPQNINVGLGHDYTIDEYYQKIASVVGYRGSFSHDLSRPTGMKQKLIDDTKLKEFGWKYKTELEQGIQQTYNYFINKVSR
ncbi:GDP-L-fucose synthetase (EC [uncultured Gammaproteobacteria bacterium]|jgi:GDP-L-fucose synthase|nr:GDP-L-fucose synthetase (EC 1.1.1.271) [uncultured Gammaproteobacteria bacterium]CAC9503757.1 GDP-L-fucose synthetase (EC 1.1.1.271) [uncultured Gammaproteobacteria bacterium]CAC9983602.1 GDP-L-fucose synthetase (EC 1.1.1.271) [uncultured Gammaproteobacteria bacterium]VVH52286.1 GDP-L-fucose synthetase (EC [uncultured Gammaproteobacteria bacterium]